MLKIRLQRVGRKHEPKFRLVLTDSKNSAKSGKFLEILGNYDSRHGEDSVFKEDKIKYWMSQGVQVSDTVHNLLINKKIIEGKKINKLPMKNPIIKEAKVSVEKSIGVLAEASMQEPAPEVTESASETVVDTIA